MRSIKAGVACILLITLLLPVLSSCGILEDIITGALSDAVAGLTSQADADSSEETPETTSAEEFAFVIDPDEKFEDELHRLAAEKTNAAISTAYKVLNGYADHPEIDVLDFDPASDPPLYDSLKDDEKKIYDTVYSAVLKGEYYEFDEFKEKDGFISSFLAVDYAISHDHAELTAYYTIDISTSIFKPVYFMPNDGYSKRVTSAADIAAAIGATQLFLAAEQRMIEKMPDGLSDYRKCIYLAACICSLCSYDKELATVKDPFQAYNAIIGGKTICQGYAEAFKRLARMAGLDCRRVENKSMTHMWCALQTADGTRYIDVTWTDSLIASQGYEFTTKYMFLTADELSLYGYGEVVEASTGQ